MKINNKIQACGYVRVSTTAQTEKESPEVQRRLIQDYCKMKNLNLTKIYEDTISGSKDARPGLDQLFTDADKGSFRSVIFSRLDRFGRSLHYILECYERLEAKGITIVSINENLDTSTPVGILTRNILATLSQFERSRIQERMTEGKLAKINRHEILPMPRIPYAYTWNKETKKIEVEPGQAKILQRIFDLYLKERLSIHKLADRLNVEGLKTAKDGLWHSSSIRFILHNPNYQGRINFRMANEIITYDLPPLISPANHQRILARLKIIPTGRRFQPI